MKIQPVILSGGSGSRLWPASRETLPKQFLSLSGSDTLLSQTLKRASKIPNACGPIIVSSLQHNFLCRRSAEALNIDARYILEEAGRNTAAAIFFSALNSNPDHILLIMPSDHWIENDTSFIETILQGIAASKECNWVTFGVRPTSPNTGYGYIKTKSTGLAALDVQSFIEKPDQQTAENFLKDQSYYWNSGIFMVKASKCIECFQRHQSELSKSVAVCWKARTIRKDEVILKREKLEVIDSISIDHAIMEKEEQISLLPLTTKWNDVGTWDSVAEMASQSKEAYDIEPILIESNNLYIHESNRLIACVGIEDLIVIDDDDALLLVHKEKAENVKQVHQLLKAKGNPIAVKHTFEQRPWGKFEILLDSHACKVKRITVDPGQRLSLQYHKKRAEHWTVVQGTASVQLNHKTLTIESGGAVDIPMGAIHSLGNNTKEPLIVIETQIGSYFGEEDIVRIDDLYGRR